MTVPAVLSSWAVFTNREPATRLLGGIEDETMDIHLGKGAKLERDDLKESVEFVWDSIPVLERDIMLSMYLTRPNNRNWIAHPDPSVREGIYLINQNHHISQAEKDYIKKLIPKAEDKSKKRLFQGDSMRVC